VGIGKAVLAEVTGASSEAAIALATLAVAALFTPIRNSLQAMVDKRFKEPQDPPRVLGKFEREVTSIIQVLDTQLLAKRLLDESVRAFGCEAGAVYVTRNGASQLLHSKGALAAPAITVPLEHDGQAIGELSLGPRDDDRPFTEAEKATLKRSASAVAKAIVLTQGKTPTEDRSVSAVEAAARSRQ
jgi:hypothetical protein